MLIWILFSLLFLIMELGHPGLFLFLSFSIGFFIVFVLGLFTDSIIFQSIGLLIGTVLGFIFLKQQSRRISPKLLKTNYEALVGKRVHILNIVSNDVIEVKVDGQIWSAIVDNSLVPNVGEVGYFVKSIKGCHLIIGKESNG